MNKYVYQIKMTVEINAFNESDAWDMIQDAFGVGESTGVLVTDCEYREVNT